jgi:predicted nuclease with RNAse H fold
MGVDVGGRRKGFDFAVVSRTAVIELGARATIEDVLAACGRHKPTLVAVDSPCAPAPDGARSRHGERSLARAVCGIRWTPDAVSLADGDYFEWIREGLALYRALHAAGAPAVEVFPTASWTRWFGERQGQRRSAWTRNGLKQIPLSGVPTRTNQDQRDAIAAALTAKQHTEGLTELFGDLVVPLAGRPM